MNDEISRFSDQSYRGLALLFFDGPGLELTDGGFRQRLLEVLIKESDDEITSLACGHVSNFPPALRQDDQVIIEGNVFATSFEYFSIKVIARSKGVLLTDGVRGWV